MSEKCNRELGDFYFSALLKWQTWDMAFLTVMSAVKDVARHLDNIAERIETKGI